tara:strand:- start:2064 stop:2237 length:174 start_codon:yes stop_codon:yes gene_type:complete
MKPASYRDNRGPRLGVYMDEGLIEAAGGLAETYPSIRAEQEIEWPGVGCLKNRVEKG